MKRENREIGLHRSNKISHLPAIQYGSRRKANTNLYLCAASCCIVEEGDNIPCLYSPAAYLRNQKDLNTQHGGQRKVVEII